MKQNIFNLVVPTSCGDFKPSAIFLRGANKAGGFSLKAYRDITPASYQRALRAQGVCDVALMEAVAAQSRIAGGEPPILEAA